MYCLVMYLFVYCLINLIDIGFELNDYIKFIAPLVSAILLCLISVVFMAHYKDVFYGFFYIIFLLGYLFNQKDDQYPIIAIMVFLFLAITYIAIKFSYDAFGIPNKNEYSQIIKNYNYYKSSL